MIDDLLRLIVDCVTDRSDLSQLQQTNQSLKQFVNERLKKLSLLNHYQSIHRSLFSSESENNDELNQYWITPWIFLKDLGIDVRISLISDKKTIYLFIRSKLQIEPKTNRVIKLKIGLDFYQFSHKANQLLWNPFRRIGGFDVGLNSHPHCINEKNEKWFTLVFDFSSIDDPQLYLVQANDESFKTTNFPKHQTSSFQYYNMWPSESSILIKDRYHLIKCTSIEKHPKIIQFDLSGQNMSLTMIKEFDRFCTFAGSFGINDRYLLFMKIINGGNILITVGIFDTHNQYCTRCFINTKKRYPSDYNFFTKTFQWCQKNCALIVSIFDDDYHFSFIDGSLKHLITNSSSRDKQIVHYIYDSYFDTNIQFR